MQSHNSKLNFQKMKKTLFLITAISVLMFGRAASAEAASPILSNVISNISATAIANGAGTSYAIAVGHSPANLRAYFYLRVNGALFSNAAKIRFGNTLLTPIFRTNNILIARVRYTSIASPGDRSVMVVNSPPNSNMSDVVAFEVVRRTPFISSISPSSTRVNRMPNGNSITIYGEDFRNDSRARLRGQNRDTEFVSATELRMTLEENDVSELRRSDGVVLRIFDHSVTVYNPGGINDPHPKGTSNGVAFKVRP